MGPRRRGSDVLTVAAVGTGATIQDGGRFGLLRFGVTPAGPMDPPALATANLALGNPPDAAAIEIAAGGIALSCDREIHVAFAGGGFRWSRDDRTLPLAARLRLHPGQSLRARAGAWGQWCYLAVPGGIDVPPVLGSRATHLRSKLGGFEGRMLAAGDRLPVRAADIEPADDAEIGAAWLMPGQATFDVVLGPQDDHFADETVSVFLSAPWRIGASADRMAIALEGPALTPAGDFNIVSDGVALGAIQIAGDGRPLVLMADRQPTGGYPKIAHVCRADIGRLAQLRSGQTCRFRRATVAEALKRRLGSDEAVATTLQRMTPLRLRPSAERLADVNLIGGVSDGSE